MTQSPHCRFCKSVLTTTFVDLGRMPLANSYLKSANDIASERPFPLHARVCDSCFLVQVDDVVPANEIFSDYAYFSSFAVSWVEHARRYAAAMQSKLRLNESSRVIEIASNDGYLLQHFVAMGVPVLGIEPAANVAQEARKRGVATEVMFFGEANARTLAARGIQADLMVANNVFAHVPDILDFAKGFAVLLKSQAIATFEFPHLLNLIEQVQFDTIYHEHYSYLSLVAVDRILEAAGLRAFDVEDLPTHGGSLRLYVCHTAAIHQPTDRLMAARARERTAHLDSLAGYAGFAPKVEAVREDFLAFLRRAREDGATVAAYGAAAKGNTFLNYCGITQADIACVFDRSTAKQGHLLPGSHVPILAPEKISEVRPDYLVVLPWNLIDEIKTSMAYINAWGGRFVTAVPRLTVHAA
jgi:C-methyltransferase C-terminal domain/Putative zinc binding domain/Methyltransferase domain